MGFFDFLIVDKKHLPDNLQSKESGWQTKSHDRGLNTLKITKEGFLLLSYDMNPEIEFDMYDGSSLPVDKYDFSSMEFIQIEFTGDIIFYQSVRGIPNEFKASFINGCLTDDLKRIK